MALTEYKIKVVDASSKPLLNFPMATRYVGADKKNNKLTSDTDGILTFQSDGRSVEIFVLAPIDENGQPDMTKFKEDNDNDNAYYRITTLNVSHKLSPSIKSPYLLTDYGIAKTKFIFYENEQDKKIYSIPLTVKVSYLIGEKKTSPRFIEAIQEVKNGELNVISILHSRIQVHPFKPDNTPFKTPQGYTPRSTTPITLPVYFDIKSNSATTEPEQPNIDQSVESSLCTCNRDLTLNEFMGILKGMRETEKSLKGTSAILNHPKCPVIGDKSHQALLNVFNKTMKKYNVNTCIRKLHFLAQTYWESDRFQTTSEYASGTYLDPGKHAQAQANQNTIIGDGPRYKGRGFMQLTWRKNYKRYFEFVIANISQYEGVFPKNITIEQLLDRNKKYPEMVASNLFLAMDSGGWFWNNGVVLKDGTTADINLQADKDNINKISLWVNGGGNGRKERIEYWENLKKVMKYDQCKNKK